MDIENLKAFIYVAKMKSFSKAAQALNITQPAVSKRVASLENELRTQLINRIARSVSLTESGEKLLPKAQELVNQALDIQRYASSLNQEVTGPLSIALSHHIALYRMPVILADFHQLYPQVKLDIQFVDSWQAMRLLETADIEFAMVTLPSDIAPYLSKYSVWNEQLHIVVNKTHPLYQFSLDAKPVTLKILSQYPSVLPSAETETQQVVSRVFSQHNVELKIQMVSNNLESLRMLVNAGIGWSLLPQSMLNNELYKVNIQMDLERDLGYIVHKNRSLSNAAKVILSMIQGA